MKRMLKRILVALLVLILLAVAGFGVLYAGRLRTVNSIERSPRMTTITFTAWMSRMIIPSTMSSTTASPTTSR